MATGLERGETAHEADEFMTVETVTLSQRPQVDQRGEINGRKDGAGDPVRRGISRRPIGVLTRRRNNSGPVCQNGDNLEAACLTDFVAF